MNGNPPQQLPPMMLWSVGLVNKDPEPVAALGYNISPDGSLVFIDQFGPLKAFNGNVWTTVTRSAIQPARGGNS